MKKSLLLVLLIIPIFCFSYDFNDGGIRNNAMGGTGISSSNDASAAVWNPALLGNLDRFELLTDFREYTIQLDNDNISQNIAYLNFPLKDIGTFVLSGNYFASKYYGEGKFGIHFGRKFISNKLFGGISINNYYINAEEAGVYKNVFDYDIGLAFSPVKIIRFGLVAKNLAQANLASESGGEDKLPMLFGFGTVLTLKRFNIAVDGQFGDYAENNDFLFAVFAVGAEFILSEHLHLRIGVNDNYFTGGFGLKLFSKNWGGSFLREELVNINYFGIFIDYSFQVSMSSDIESYIGDHFIGLKIDFGKTLTTKEKTSKYPFPTTEKKAEVRVDTVFVEKVRVDTLIKEVTVFDTVTIVEKEIEERVDTVFVEKVRVDTLIKEVTVFDTVIIVEKEIEERVDTVFVEKVRVDTLIKEVTVFDTVTIVEKEIEERIDTVFVEKVRVDTLVQEVTVYDTVTIVEKEIEERVDTVFVEKVRVDTLVQEVTVYDTVTIVEKEIEERVDTVFVEKVRVDTLIKEVAVFDTVTIVKMIIDQDSLEKRVSEEIQRLRSDDFARINEASVYLTNSLEYFYAEDYEKAIQECKKAIKIAPNLSLVYLRLGSIYYKLGDISNALYYWRQGKKIDPDNKEINKILKDIEKETKSSETKP
ncbi:MAG: tetratricopeptide repeat protein [Candidatus Cloacimonetes bacterium]|nr:tetratricopeptide repeat protein [Candidatus Cloacimonadota bacterium]MBL7086372.1 tetratricopeptide repeat protein [Candidatus Cloacimonadota bacterium]